MYMAYMKVSGAALLVLGAACALYLALWLTGRVVWGLDVTIVLIGIGCVWTLTAGAARLFLGHPLLNTAAVWPRAALLCALSLGAAVFIAAQVCIIDGMRRPAPDAVGVIIVPGARIWGDEPSIMLRHRLDGALELRARHPGAVIMVSGGQGADEAYTEAHVMARYLRGRGVPEEHIWLEDRSVNTRQNIAFSRDIINARGADALPVAVVSSDYHMYRCRRYALRAGIGNAGVYGVYTTPLQRPVCHIREGISVARDWALALFE